MIVVTYTKLMQAHLTTNDVKLLQNIHTQAHYVVGDRPGKTGKLSLAKSISHELFSMPKCILSIEVLSYYMTYLK